MKPFLSENRLLPLYMLHRVSLIINTGSKLSILVFHDKVEAMINDRIPCKSNWREKDLDYTCLM